MKRLLKGLCPEGEALLNLIPGGVMQCRNDSSYTIVEVNDGFLSMFGFTREELDEQFQNRFFHMIHPSDQQNFLIEVERQLEKSDRLSLSYRVLCKDGNYKWIASSEQLFGDEKEERFFCIFLDLTEVRDAQEKLRLSLEHLEIIMNQSSDIIFEWDLIADSISFPLTGWKSSAMPRIMTAGCRRKKCCIIFIPMMWSRWPHLWKKPKGAYLIR